MSKTTEQKLAQEVERKTKKMALELLALKEKATRAEDWALRNALSLAFGQVEQTYRLAARKAASPSSPSAVV